MAIILVTGRVGRTRGGRIGDFDDDAALDSVVSAVGYVQVALSVDYDAVVVEKLAWSGTVENAALAGCSTGWILVNWSAVWGKLDHPPVV
jgi:hypothetical protein